MTNMGRRLVLSGATGLAATGGLSRPHIANAAGTTTTVWQVQGFVPQEDEAFRKTVADYQKASGNKIDLSVMPFQALNQKAISAITSGEVPDVIFHDAPATILPQTALDNKLEDVSDVVEAQKSKLSETALLNSTFYNATTKQRSIYLVPVKQAVAPFHIWGDLVTKAGFKLSDAPNTWDAFWDFFKPVQTALRAKGMRKLYAMGMQITTVGPNDGNGLFAHFLIANGGQNIVTRDGNLHVDDPQVREAAIKSVAYMTNCYKEGYIPLEALSWNDADDNNAYHEKQFVMNLDGTLSPELAMIKNKKAYYEEAVVMGLPNRNDGTPMAAVQGAGGGFIPKGAKNIATAKDFLKFFIQPEVMNENLKNGLGRWVPTIPQIARDDPWWTDTKDDPHRATYVREAVFGPTFPAFAGFNPAWGLVNAEQLWGVAHADVIKNGMTPTAAVDKAFKRAETLFARYRLG
ncbi:ABC transporter substrate-binding protein [Acidisphaera sp. S103]|uniref:ABC transporter substrate-binding protein n=1 Tax=Acidisphaera sp. S103 TaxID=1747223 RepID=UPI00131E7F07|nr:ABC transporter substrate-binding protein [Acidisphaera sp. S103]